MHPVNLRWAAAACAAVGYGTCSVSGAVTLPDHSLAGGHDDFTPAYGFGDASPTPASLPAPPKALAALMGDTGVAVRARGTHVTPQAPPGDASSVMASTAAAPPSLPPRGDIVYVVPKPAVAAVVPAPSAALRALLVSLWSPRASAADAAPPAAQEAARAEGATALEMTRYPLHCGFFEGELEICTGKTNATPMHPQAQSELIIRGVFTRELAGPVMMGGSIDQRLNLESAALRSAAHFMCWLLPRFYKEINLSCLDSDRPWISAPLKAIMTKTGSTPALPDDGVPAPHIPYEFRAFSRNIDLEQWAVVGLPGLSAMPLTGWWGCSPLTLYLFEGGGAGAGADVEDGAIFTMRHLDIHVA